MTSDCYQATYPLGNPVVDPKGPSTGSVHVMGRLVIYFVQLREVSMVHKMATELNFELVLKNLGISSIRKNFFDPFSVGAG